MLQNEDLLSKLQNDNTLISSSITRIEIKDNDGFVSVTVDMQLLYSKEYKQLQLRFVNVKEYSFYHRSDYIFYNVEIYKLFKCEDGLFYASFDPVDESNVRSKDDQDFILSESIEGVLKV